MTGPLVATPVKLPTAQPGWHGWDEPSPGAGSGIAGNHRQLRGPWLGGHRFAGAGRSTGCRANPVRRSGTPGEIAASIALLAKPGASYITGEMIVVDGGNCLQERKA